MYNIKFYHHKNKIEKKYKVIKDDTVDLNNLLNLLELKKTFFEVL